MVVSWYVGLIFGRLSQRAVDENIAKYKEANPIPLEDHVQDEQLQTEQSVEGDTQEAALPGAEVFSETSSEAFAGSTPGVTPGSAAGVTQREVVSGTAAGAGMINT